MSYDLATVDSLKASNSTRGGAKKPPVENMSCKQFVQVLAAAGCKRDDISKVVFAVWNGYHPQMRWAKKVEKIDSKGKTYLADESTSETLSETTIRSRIWYDNGVKRQSDRGVSYSDSHLKIANGKLVLPARVAAIVEKTLPAFWEQLKKDKRV